MRFTMMILGPRVLLTVKMCMSRRQNMMKSRARMMRPGYSRPGVSLAGTGPLVPHRARPPGAASEVGGGAGPGGGPTAGAGTSRSPAAWKPPGAPANLQASPATKSRMAARSSLFQKSLK